MKIYWNGVKDGDCEGQFIDRASQRVVAQGAYGTNGYDVLMASGDLVTYPTPMVALGALNACCDTPSSTPLPTKPQPSRR